MACDNSKFPVWLVTFFLLFGCTLLDDHPTGAIEVKYAAPGPQAVTIAPSSQCCDHRGNSYDLYYPTNLTGAPHALIAWANGTNAVSNRVSYLLRHWASWNFVVIATRDRFTGDGTTVLDSVNFMLHANSDPNSIFFHTIDTNHIGGAGHSQGAGGAIRAMLASNGKIATVIPIELPGQQFCLCSPNQVLDTASITQGSVFFVDGSNDIPISPPTQAPQEVGEQSLAAFYAAVPSNVPKLTATLLGPTHNDVTGQPGCNTAAPPCLVGVYGYLGYPTAWMADRLGLDPTAHAAFVSGTGEIFSQTSHWAFVQSNIQ
ncbi:MAG: hypothetical protein JO058_10300 [Alphaproteobacteria bacterium]|nr:hypothetical protein [Alphaproteobacteria bacterium]